MEEKRFANVILENREKLSLSAVTEVLNFDNETIILSTDIGSMTVKGENLRIISFDNKAGELLAQGKIDAIVYTHTKTKENFLKKVFK